MTVTQTCRALCVLCLVTLGGAWGQDAAEQPPAEAAPAEAAPVEQPPAQAQPPAEPLTIGKPPEQVSVAVKVVEFQFTKGVETGLSAFFQNVLRPEPFGRVSNLNNVVQTADLTFPTSSTAGITVFLDRIRLTEGDMEIVLQALVDENRAFILSRPRVLTKVGAPNYTRIATSQDIPYEDTVVVGSTAVQVTKFRPTGVILNVKAEQVRDLDGNWEDSRDTYIQLDIDAEVKEEGQRVVIALDDALVSNLFGQGQSAIRVPEFVTRRIRTRVWVQHGQVLVLGGLYRNTDTKSLTTIPWLTQVEDASTGLLERMIAGNVAVSPVSSTLGNRSKEESRRELVFLIKSEVWRESFTVIGDIEPEEEEAEGPSNIITDVIQGITGIPQELGERIQRDNGEGGVDSNLGSRDR